MENSNGAGEAVGTEKAAAEEAKVDVSEHDRLDRISAELIECAIGDFGSADARSGPVR